MIFGYARVSGMGQDLKLQVSQLKHAGVPTDQVYAEKYRGTTKDRPLWNELYHQLRKEDEVVFTL